MTPQTEKFHAFLAFVTSPSPRRNIMFGLVLLGVSILVWSAAGSPKEKKKTAKPVKAVGLEVPPAATLNILRSDAHERVSQVSLRQQHRDLSHYLSVVQEARQIEIDSVFDNTRSSSSTPVANYRTVMREFLPLEPGRDPIDQGPTCNVRTVGFGPNNSAPSRFPGIHQFDENPFCRSHRLMRCNRNRSRGNRNRSGKRKEKKAIDEDPKDEAEKKGRALVLYMMHNTSDAASTLHRPTEWDNFQFFLKHGLLDATQSTVLFDRVDYVFIRINTAVTAAQEVATLEDFSSAEDEGPGCTKTGGTARRTAKGIAQDLREKILGNVRFFWVPAVSCDLCAHWHVMNTLGIGGGVNTEQQHASTFSPLTYAPKPRLIPVGVGSKQVMVDYKSVVLMNSGVRGPFVNGVMEGGHDQGLGEREPTWVPSWIDQVSMGEDIEVWNRNFRRPMFGRFDADTFETLSVAALSRMMRFHAQTYFLVAPKSLVALLHQLQARGCDGGGGMSSSKGGPKQACINVVELETISGLHVHQQGNSQKRFRKPPTHKFYSLSLNDTYRYPRSIPEENSGWEWIMAITKPVIQREIIKDPKKLGTDNPTLYHVDPCRAIFMKFGGNVFPRIPDSTLNAAYHLTAAQRTFPSLPSSDAVKMLRSRRSIRRYNNKESLCGLDRESLNENHVQKVGAEESSHAREKKSGHHHRALTAVVRRVKGYKMAMLRAMASKWL